jgi:mannosyl-3-phosphoglycerate phosphatase
LNITPEPHRTVIFSDLDGTLLDRDTYSYQKARIALNAARHRNIPVVFCSSKTRMEQVAVRRELGIRDPFIVEDGGAIFVEDGYFESEFSFDRAVDDFCVIELGTSYETIRRAIDSVRSETGIQLKGYGDMTPSEVAEVTGLVPAAAELAMKREYQETVVSRHDPNELEAITNALAQRGLRLTKGGRFLAVSGQHDKGAAVDLLAAMYRREFGDVRIVGIGDSYNDLSMLAAVDVPVLVQKEPGVWEAIGTPNLVRVDAVGPEGWSWFVSKCLR